MRRRSRQCTSRASRNSNTHMALGLKPSGRPSASVNSGSPSRETLIVPNDRIFGLRFYQKIKDRHIQGGANLSHRLDGRAALIPFYLTQKTGRKIYLFSQCSQAEVKLLTARFNACA